MSNLFLQFGLSNIRIWSCIIGRIRFIVLDKMKTTRTATVIVSVFLWLWISETPAADDGSIDLLRCGDFCMWREPVGDWKIVGEVMKDARDGKKLTGKAGKDAMLNGDKGRTHNIITKDEFGDVELHIEFMVPEKSNSGVYLMARYEIQVFDSWGIEHPKYSDCGGIYQRWADGKGFEGRAPAANASRKPGEWQTFDAIFKAPRFDKGGKKIANAIFVKVVHNDKVIHENQEVTGPTRASTYNDEKAVGPLMLQGDHGPVAYRNIRIRPLK
ncbi:MAG: DUF1080 domain-containing protein [Kiritimatiellae bacterium]|nr:DUF1080 domain-containing protein [Kiritimatiellia bacterium]MDD5522899.1 DUF1080 domain-containing protein [Kiritimatiellia bacterium]